MKNLLFTILTIVLFISCDQYFSRNLGGNITINLAPGERLVEATWKNSDLWYLVEPMDSDYEPKTKVFKESSLWGAFEGSVPFVEYKTDKYDNI